MKKFLPQIRTGTVNTSWISAKFNGFTLSSIIAGRGRRTGSICDIPIYRTTAPQIKAVISLFLLMVWVNATLTSSSSAKAAVKPVLFTTSTRCSGETDGSHRTVALFVARFTVACTTPSTRRSARSTEAEQAAQVIPCTLIFTCLVSFNKIILSFSYIRIVISLSFSVISA